MSPLIQALARVRNCVCAVMRIRKRKPAADTDGPEGVGFSVSVLGTAWAIVADRLLLTAHHVLNGGDSRNLDDRFLVLTPPPPHGEVYGCFPVIGFPLEDPGRDLAVLEIRPPEEAEPHILALPITCFQPMDGTRVLTYGFPFAQVTGADLDPRDNAFVGMQCFFRGHANEGIVAAQYEIDGVLHYEFNVAWHDGESGGPVCLLEPLAALAMMQYTRGVQTPQGFFVPGPRRGIALAAAAHELALLGAQLV